PKITLNIRKSYPRFTQSHPICIAKKALTQQPIRFEYIQQYLGMSPKEGVQIDLRNPIRFAIIRSQQPIDIGQSLKDHIGKGEKYRSVHHKSHHQQVVEDIGKCTVYQNCAKSNKSV